MVRTLLQKVCGQVEKDRTLTTLRLGCAGDLQIDIYVIMLLTPFWRFRPTKKWKVYLESRWYTTEEEQLRYNIEPTTEKVPTPVIIAMNKRQSHKQSVYIKRKPVLPLAKPPSSRGIEDHSFSHIWI